MKREYDIGDLVTVAAETMNSITLNQWEWAKNFAPKYLRNVDNVRSPSKEKDNIFRIITTSAYHKQKSHSTNFEKDVFCLIQNVTSEKCYIVQNDKLSRFISNFSIGNIVKVLNVHKVFTQYPFWIEQNAPDWIYFYKENEIPSDTKKYKVIAIAPKADFPPYDKENLVLILDEALYNVYLVSESGLYLISHREDIQI
ncbi:MAG: hypothetical protein ACI37Z_05110 [Candidatus Gastranaerophilaceae bacterium]